MGAWASSHGNRTPNGSKQAQTRNTGAVHVRVSRIGSDMNVPADGSAAVATLILAGGVRRGAALPSRYAGSFIERSLEKYVPTAKRSPRYKPK